MKLLEPPAAAPQLPAVHPGEPMLQIALNGQVISLPVSWAQLLIWQHLPEWLRDSSKAIVLPKDEQMDEADTKQGRIFLELARSGIKNLVRPFLGFLLRRVYGKDMTRWPPGVALPKGREDTLPIIDRMVIDFLITQAYYHPFVIEYEPTSGLVTGFRLGYRVAPSSDTGNSADSAGAASGGSEAAEKS